MKKPLKDPEAGTRSVPLNGVLVSDRLHLQHGPGLARSQRFLSPSNTVAMATPQCRVSWVITGKADFRLTSHILESEEMKTWVTMDEKQGKQGWLPARHWDRREGPDMARKGCLVLSWFWGWSLGPAQSGQVPYL